MNSLEEKIESAKTQFASADCKIELVEGNAIHAVNKNSDRKYRLPELMQANNFRVPGWYLAGIWDDMSLPNRGGFVDYVSTGWGFHMQFETGLWSKTLPNDYHLKLVFQPGINQFYIENELGHKENVAILPTRSVFHAMMLLEENNWFGSGESAVETKSISDYRIAV